MKRAETTYTTAKNRQAGQHAQEAVRQPRQRAVHEGQRESRGRDRQRKFPPLEDFRHRDAGSGSSRGDRDTRRSTICPTTRPSVGPHSPKRGMSATSSTTLMPSATAFEMANEALSSTLRSSVENWKHLAHHEDQEYLEVGCRRDVFGGECQPDQRLGEIRHSSANAGRITAATIICARFHSSQTLGRIALRALDQVGKDHVRQRGLHDVHQRHLVVRRGVDSQRAPAPSSCPPPRGRTR